MRDRALSQEAPSSLSSLPLTPVFLPVPSWHRTPPGISEGAPSRFCLPGEEARPQPDAISPRLPGPELAWPLGGVDSDRRVGDKGTQRQQLKASKVCKQSGLTVRKQSSFQRLQESSCFSRMFWKSVHSPFFFPVEETRTAVQGLQGD